MRPPVPELGPDAPGSSLLGRDLRLVLEHVLPVWAALALLGLLSGLLWRAVPHAQPPELFALLTALGPAYWLAGATLGVGAARMLARQYAHVQAQSLEAQQRISAVFALGGVAALLALAPAGLLIAYAPWQAVLSVETVDPAEVHLRLGLLLLIPMLFGGTVLAVLSATVLLLLRRRGLLGALLWLVAGVVVNTRALMGISGTAAPLWLPPALGHAALDGLNDIVGSSGNWDYLRSVFTVAFTPVVVTLAGVLALLGLVLWLTRHWGRALLQAAPTPFALPLAAWTALATVAMRAAGQQLRYQAEVAYRFPGDWRDLFLVAALTLWAVYVAASVLRNSGGQMTPMRAERLRAHELLWLPLLLLGCTFSTLPNVIADQVGQLEVLRYAALWLAPLLAGLALTHAALRLLCSGYAPLGAALLLALAAVMIPLDGARSGMLLNLLNRLGDTLAAPQLWALWAAMVLLSLAVLAPPRLTRRSPVAQGLSSG